MLHMPKVLNEQLMICDSQRNAIVITPCGYMFPLLESCMFAKILFTDFALQLFFQLLTLFRNCFQLVVEISQVLLILPG